MTSSETLRRAGQCLFLSALLHFVAPFAAGFAPEGLITAAFGVLFVLIGAGFTRGWRWLGLLSDPVLLILTFANYTTLGTSAVPDGLIWATLAADLAALAFLFVALWQRPVPRAPM